MDEEIGDETRRGAAPGEGEKAKRGKRVSGAGGFGGWERKQQENTGRLLRPTSPRLRVDVLWMYPW